MPAVPPVLVLFDIDGTLMITRGAGSRCIERACRSLFGEQFRWGPITVGTLDPQIFEQLCAHNAVTDPRAHHDRYREAYLAELERELRGRRDDVMVMPGIAPLLDELWRRGDVVTGVLTGNYARAAAIKLAAAGIDRQRFAVFAAAEDGQQRSDLAPAAMRQYARIVGHPVEPGRVVVVGDTPRDVACAHAHGCHAFAVATGRYSVDQLAGAGADTVVRDLIDSTPLRRLIDRLTENHSAPPGADPGERV